MSGSAAKDTPRTKRYWAAAQRKTPHNIGPHTYTHTHYIVDYYFYVLRGWHTSFRICCGSTESSSSDASRARRIYQKKPQTGRPWSTPSTRALPALRASMASGAPLLNVTLLYGECEHCTFVFPSPQVDGIDIADVGDVGDDGGGGGGGGGGGDGGGGGGGEVWRCVRRSKTKAHCGACGSDMVADDACLGCPARDVVRESTCRSCGYAV